MPELLVCGHTGDWCAPVVCFDTCETSFDHLVHESLTVFIEIATHKFQTGKLVRDFQKQGHEAGEYGFLRVYQTPLPAWAYQFRQLVHPTPTAQPKVAP